MIKVLAVDDDLDFHEILKVKLDPKEFELTLVTTEIEFLLSFENNKYDAFLLDLSFDGSPLKGFEILGKIRQEKNNDTPIIVLSNSNSSKIVSSALELGANDFINKPVDGKLLSRKIKELIGGNAAFSKELELGSTPGKKSPVKLLSNMRLVSISELGFVLEGTSFVARGYRIRLKSPRIKEIFGTESIEVYSTGFSSEISGTYINTFELNPDQKDTVLKVKEWITANLSK